MDRETRRRFEEYRREQAGPIENTLIDELADGELDRGEFLQRATMFGLSVSAIGAALELSGHNPLAHAAPVAHKVGGRLKVGIIPPPVSSLDPHTYKDTGGLQTGSICGEFLTRATQSLTLTSGLPVTVDNTQNRYILGYRQGPQYQVDTYTPAVVAELLVGARVTYQTLGTFLPVIQR